MKYIINISFTLLLITQTINAQMNVEYIQNFTFKIPESDYYLKSDTVMIGENITNTEPQGKVIVPTGSTSRIVGYYPSYTVIIKQGFEIQTGSSFSFWRTYPVGNESLNTKEKENKSSLNLNGYEYEILGYGVDDKNFVSPVQSLYIDPINFASSETGHPKWGIERYEEGLNFWRPAYYWEENRYTGNYKIFINPNGNIGIGTGTPNYKLDVNGDIATNGTLFFTSDKRLKTNIQPLKNNQLIYKLQGKSYTKQLNNNNKQYYNNLQIGLIAQDVNEVFPEIISKDSSDLLSIDYLALLPLIIETIKEQNQTYLRNSEKIKKLKKQIEVKNEENLF